ncbi:MAG: hypothetical protein ACP5QR_08955 [Rhizomicrobium sp.]
MSTLCVLDLTPKIPSWFTESGFHEQALSPVIVKIFARTARHHIRAESGSYRCDRL